MDGSDLPGAGHDLNSGEVPWLSPLGLPPLLDELVPEEVDELASGEDVLDVLVEVDSPLDDDDDEGTLLLELAAAAATVVDVVPMVERVVDTDQFRGSSNFCWENSVEETFMEKYNFCRNMTWVAVKSTCPPHVA